MYFLALLLVGAAPPADVVSTSARLDSASLATNSDYEIELDVKLADGWSASDSGMPGPLLQIAVPDCAKLEGAELTGHDELSHNDFLHAPFERLLEPGETRIRFTLTSEPGKDDRFGLNVLAYVSKDGGEENWFVRRRIELPVAAGAKAAGVESTKSDWGPKTTLAIGERIEPFDLPTLDGGKLALGDVLGKQNVVITTYRAFW